MLVYYWCSASLKNLKFYRKGREKNEEKRKKGRKEGIVSIVSLLNNIFDIDVVSYSKIRNFIEKNEEGRKEERKESFRSF